MRALIDRALWAGLSLIVAAGLWYWFANEKEVAATVPVSIQYRNLPNDLEMTSEPPGRFFLRLRGPASRLTAEDLRNIGITFDLASIHDPGDETFAVTEKELGLPAGVTLVRAVPSHVRLEFHKRIERYVPVEVRLNAQPPAGYRIASQHVNPQSVRIAGPEPNVRNVAAASTDGIDLGSAVGHAKFRVPVSVDDPSVRLMGSPSHVDVEIKLEKIP